jgi:orotidine-5'-phosphate decarboxylase
MSETSESEIFCEKDNAAGENNATADVGDVATAVDIAPAEKIIVALDCSAAEARDLACQLQGQASWLKVGMTLYYGEGPAIVREFKQMGFKVFVDLKLHDIPHQVRGAARAVTLAGADMLSVHAAGGVAMMQQARAGAAEAAGAGGAIATDGEAAAGSGGSDSNGSLPILLAITVLTSIDHETLNRIGVTSPLPKQVENLAELAMRAGLDGVVASPQEVEALRGKFADKPVIVTPGVRPSGSETQDQQRVATPRSALLAGADYLVIGRPITAHTSPRQAFKDIVGSLQ